MHAIQCTQLTWPAWHAMRSRKWRPSAQQGSYSTVARACIPHLGYLGSPRAATLPDDSLLLDCACLPAQTCAPPPLRSLLSTCLKSVVAPESGIFSFSGSTNNSYFTLPITKRRYLHSRPCMANPIHHSPWSANPLFVRPTHHLYRLHVI